MMRAFRGPDFKCYIYTYIPMYLRTCLRCRWSYTEEEEKKDDAKAIPSATANGIVEKGKQAKEADAPAAPAPSAVASGTSPKSGANKRNGKAK
jgi:hypothetical protein